MNTGMRDATTTHRRTNENVLESQTRRAESRPSSQGDVRHDKPVLVVDDDPKLVTLVRMYLEREGFRVIAAYDGEQALALAARHRPEFVILDLMLPKMDGITVCRRLRKTSNVPILMLTAKVEETDKIVGLQVGADDYVTKPFSPRELVARVQAILRRAAPAARLSPELVQGGLVMHLDRHEVTLDGHGVQFTAFEYKLLQTLMEFPGRVFTRDQLLAHLYAFDEAAVTDRTVDVHIGKIREKLGDDPAQPRYIQTIRGVGYRLLEHDRAG
jgi:DNA-binding response OmpR family regulator